VVGVGGTEFTSASIIGTTFWSAENNTKNLGSALSYPPEDVWNDSCGAAKCGANNVFAAASSGGASKVFTKPSWQSGLPGIPSDGARDVPDVSFTASPQNAPYLICLGETCEGTISSTSFTPIGGTSAGTPSFAGIMALVDQKMKSRQGAVNYVLYRLAAAQQYSQCNGSSTTKLPESTCVFNDITSGDSSVPGEPSYGKSTAKYAAGVGYDLATGLGSINVANLVNNWSSVSFKATSTTLAISPGTIPHGTPANVQASVTPQSGSGTATGNVSVEAASGAGYGVFPLTSGSADSTLASLPGGTYMVHGHYSGDTAFAPSDSAAVPVTVTPEASRRAGSGVT
jgi:subtilase family serine protease